MKIALWIIAVCEVVRAVQNALQLRSLAESHDAMNKAYDSIAKSADDLDLLDEETFKKMYMAMGSTYSAMESDEEQTDGE